MRVLVINVLGVVFLEPLDCPFRTVDGILEAYRGAYDLAVLDIHAEATSEKLALGRYFDGRIGIIFGTHTHVQTADARILPGGTGYLTDLGMCGPADSILGVETERVIARLKDHLPVRFANPVGETELNGAVFTYDRQAHRCLSVEPVRRTIL
jgi:calcineurin-like phosphoesterase